VDLPDASNRSKILQVILGQEELAEGFDVAQLAADTEGYSGSDLKNLCVAAAYRPVREILEREKEEAELAKEGAEAGAEAADAPPAAKRAKAAPREAPYIRPIKLDDFTKAKEQVCASVNKDAVSMQELHQWNEMYGEGGSRRTEALSYFL